MGILRVIFTFILISIANVYAIEINQVELRCNERPECDLVLEKFNEIVGKKLTSEQFYAFLENELEKKYYNSFYFSINDDSLYIEAEMRYLITDVEFISDDESLNQRMLASFALKKGDYYDENIVEESIYKIQDLYFYNNENALKYRIEDDNGFKLVFTINNDKIRKVKNINIHGVDQKLEKEFNHYWSDILSLSWDRISFKKKLDAFREYLEKLGYWQATVKDEVEVTNVGVDVDLSIDLGKRYGFSLHGAKYFDHQTILKEIKKSISGMRDELTPEIISQVLSNLYKARGIFYSDFDIRSGRGVEDSGFYNHFFINIKEGKKVKIAEFVYSGNILIPEENLNEVYEKNSTDLLKNGFLDIEGLNAAASRLREYYVTQGLVYSKVENPFIAFSDDGNSAYVTFKIVENDRYRLGSVNIEGVSDNNIKEKIKSIMTNKEKAWFNVLEVDNDLKKALEVLKQEGYFFSSYKLKNPKEIVLLNNVDKIVNLRLSFDIGKKTFLGDLLITGNEKTKDQVINRELKIKKGEVVTPEVMNGFVNRLRTLGLFSSVNISPFVGAEKDKESIWLNFIVKVKEKAFGRAEFAPGYRTDLGYKASLTTSYNNVQGMNRTFIVKAQANRRTSLSDLDSERQKEDKHVIERFLQIQFVEPYLFQNAFDNPLEFRTSIKYQLKRYNSFDADIRSISPSLNKMLSDKVEFNLAYEYDIIRQFDATLNIDNDSYGIGAITPSLTWDLRDNAQAPRSGAWFNFSWEFANPYFGSQKEDDLTINYNRALLRSFFYFPVGKIVMATSLTLGAEKNFANELIYNEDGTPKIDSETNEQETRGYIPSLKVFRLSGIDLLRGFSDNESNKLVNGTSLSDIIVRDSAYLINLKLESRYYFDDNSATALFLDAGRVYLNSVNPLDLRTSAGFSFKVLTPVGSLDFDYGVKLKRERYDSGREKFGRFHITIGQF